jgi:hypothetical protein
MFLKTSRYYKLEEVESQVTDDHGKLRNVKAIKLRRLPTVSGELTEVKSNHRLDIIAQQQYKDSARFWHIADANTELLANDLVEETGGVINVPEK